MYYIYKTTNLVNNKIYIGIHKSDNIKNDNYIGSGKELKRAIDAFGEDNFKRQILFEYNNKKVAYKMEAKIVDEEFVQRTDTYNMATGGEGG